MVNEQEFGVAFLEANITENKEQGSSILEGHIENVPTSVGEHVAWGRGSAPV